MQGAVREIALEIVRADGSRLPALVNSVLRRDDERRARARPHHACSTPPTAAGTSGSCWARRAAEASEARVRELASSMESLIQIQAASGATATPQVLADDSFAHSFLEEAPIIPGAQTRPNLKIQEGCSNRCSFCVIPQTRGNSRSLSASAVLSHVRNFVEAGGNELVFSGINLGRWGRDLERSHPEPRNLAALVRAIFDHTTLPRLRLSSIEPMDWDPDLIALVPEFAGNRLARHAHLPLQSGSDSVLRRMHRRYRPWHYAEKVERTVRGGRPCPDHWRRCDGRLSRRNRQRVPRVVRFHPLAPVRLPASLPVLTPPRHPRLDAACREPVPAQIVDQRMSALRALAAEKTRAHRTSFIGAELDAITLHTPPALAASCRTSALTDNFLPVELAASLPANQLVRIRVTGSHRRQSLLRAIPVLSAASQHDSTVEFRSQTTEPALETAF